MQAAEAFRQQAEACVRHGSPMYDDVLRALVEDLEAGGPTAVVLAGHEDDTGPSALALRLLGSVHRLVLERRAGRLAAYVPSVGGTWDPASGPAAYVDLLAREPEAVRERLDRPPQTNEVGRASALIGGLLHLPEELRRPVRLLELGSSAGLIQLADRFAYVDGDGTTTGDPGSPVVLDPAWEGGPLTPWRDLEIVEREGCDPMPVDATSTEGRLTLTAYVWPDQTGRLERLRGALSLAQRTPPVVRRLGAGDFVGARGLRTGTVTVLWHSVMWQYLPAAEQVRVSRRIEVLGSEATSEQPFAHLVLEPTRRTPDQPHEFLVVLTTWPGGVRRVLGRSRAHGVPTTWEPAPG